MKRIIIVLIVVLVVLIGALATWMTLHKNAPTPTVSSADFGDATSQNSDTISTFTGNCFKWYIQGYANRSTVVGTKNYEAATAQIAADAGSCFTPEFISQWPTITSNTEGDPVLLSQDYESSWAANVTTSITQQSATDAAALVNLGSNPQWLKQLIVHLTYTANGWRISGVTSGS
jgi:hypothetical protein